LLLIPRLTETRKNAEMLNEGLVIGEKKQMQVTNEARDALKQVFKDQNAEGVRLYFAGFG
jgi:hypothetical protein